MRIAVNFHEFQISIEKDPQIWNAEKEASVQAAGLRLEDLVDPDPEAQRMEGASSSASQTPVDDRAARLLARQQMLAQIGHGRAPEPAKSRPRRAPMGRPHIS